MSDSTSATSGQEPGAQPQAGTIHPESTTQAQAAAGTTDQPTVDVAVLQRELAEARREAAAGDLDGPRVLGCLPRRLQAGHAALYAPIGGAPTSTPSPAGGASPRTTCAGSSGASACWPGWTAALRWSMSRSDTRPPAQVPQGIDAGRL